MTGPVPPAAAPPAGTAGTSAGTAATAAGAATPEPAGEASLEQLPDKLRELLRTVVVSGTVVEQTGDGNVKVRTQAGEVSLKTPTPLPQDKQVTLQIPPGNPPLKALVFMVSPPLPQATAPTVPPPAVPPPPVTVSNLPPPTGAPAVAPHVAVPVAAPPVAVGTVIQATVASTSPPPAPQTPAAPAPQASVAPQASAAPQAPPTPQTSAVTQAPTAPPTPVARGQQPPLNPAPTPATPPAPAPQEPAPPIPQDARTPPAPPSPVPPQSSPALAPTPAPLQQTKAPPAAPAAPAPTPTVPPVQTPPIPAAPSSAAPPSPSPAPVPPPAPAPAQPAAQQMPALKPGNAVEVRVVALPPQGATPLPPQSSPLPSPPLPSSPPPGASSPPPLTAIVAGTTSAGQPIVTTDRGVMVLNTRTPLAPGTQVTIGLPPPRPAPAETFDPLRGQDWPALRETLDVLAKADPSGTRTLANAILPQANGRLAATLMAFTGSIKKGDARAWLGEKATKALEALGRTDLLEKLEDDFRQLARQAAEVPPGEWKPYSIPFSDGAELHRILMHVRQPDADKVDEDANGVDGHGARANRFLIDLTLSRIGELQLDGLLRPRRFDLILRTHMPLPAEMRQEIGKLFHDSLETLGMTGAVSFQAGTQGWVAVLPGLSGSVGMSA